jgi:dipeptidyl aminopeptidase/acylaminoacyl peptidase
MVKFRPKEVAWIGDEGVKGDITGVIVSFHGLGFGGMKEGPSPEEERWAAEGALCVFPYYGPWSWMNRQARAMVDTLIGEIYAEYHLDPTRVPLLLAGGSMGGCSALLYARYSVHPLAACFANCPVCDLTYHFDERPDLPRTMYYAFGSYEGEMQALLEEHSPLHQVAHMPDIDYLIVHGTDDTAVAKAAHSDRMVPAMRARGLRVDYQEIPGMGHCGPLPEETSALIDAHMRRALAKRNG